MTYHLVVYRSTVHRCSWRESDLTPRRHSVFRAAHPVDFFKHAAEVVRHMLADVAATLCFAWDAALPRGRATV